MSSFRPALRTQAFFNCWTRKEAYVKAVGRGLALPLHSFDVSLGEASAACLLRAPEAGDDGRSWSLAAPQLEDGVSAAVVLEGGAFHIVSADATQELSCRSCGVDSSPAALI